MLITTFRLVVSVFFHVCSCSCICCCPNEFFFLKLESNHFSLERELVGSAGTIVSSAARRDETATRIQLNRHLRRTERALCTNARRLQTRNFEWNRNYIHFSLSRAASTTLFGVCAHCFRLFISFDSLHAHDDDTIQTIQRKNEIDKFVELYDASETSSRECRRCAREWIGCTVTGI